MAFATKTDKAQKKAEKTFIKAKKTTGKKAEKLNKVATKQAAVAGKKFEDFQHTVADRFQEGIDKATPVLEDAASKARLKAGEFASVAAEKLNEVEVPTQAQALATKAGYNKRDLKKTQKQAVKAANKFAKEQKKAAKKPGKGLLIVGLLVAAGVAGYAAYKASRPVEDPWKTPVKPASETKIATPVAPQNATTKSADPDSDISRSEAGNNPKASTQEKSSEDVVAQTSKAPVVGKHANTAPTTDATENFSSAGNTPSTSYQTGEEGVEAKGSQEK
ncbi:hypothetical protein [uncultured Rothia sp.]|uniref:hypothetical protein n=1 Tax=uncultured Rothia sp. TaxID=316088 RepID=UPI003216E3C1